MAPAHRCPACGCESDSLPDLTCRQCGKKFLRPASFWPWLAGLATVVLVTGLMFAFHFPRPMILFSGLATVFITVLGLHPRQSISATRKSMSETRKSISRPMSSQPMSVTLLDLTIAILGLAFLSCLLFGFVTFINTHNAFKSVQGQPYHAAIFQVIRPYYQKSAGMHGPDIAVYASGIVEGQKEWMDLLPYLKRVPGDQVELNSWVPPGSVIPIYLFPGLRGQNRVQVIDVLPPGEASRKTETWVLRGAPMALAVLGALIFLLVRVRRSRASSATQAMGASA